MPDTLQYLQLQSIVDSLAFELRMQSAKAELSATALEMMRLTNEQLGLWSNPYGLLVGILATLFTVLAVVATVILFRQDKAWQNRLNKALFEFQSRFEVVEKELRATIDVFMKEKDERFELEINEQRKLLEGRKQDTTEITKIEARIQKLEENRKVIATKRSELTSAPAVSGSMSSLRIPPHWLNMEEREVNKQDAIVYSPLIRPGT